MAKDKRATTNEINIRPDSTFRIRVLGREETPKGKLLHVVSETRPLSSKQVMQQWRQFMTGSIGNGEARIWHEQGSRYVTLQEVQKGSLRLTVQTEQ